MCVVYLLLSPFILVGLLFTPLTFIGFLQDGNPVPFIISIIMVLGSFALIRKVKQRIKEVAEEEYTKNEEYGSHHSTLLDVDNDHPHDSTNRK